MKNRRYNTPQEAENAFYQAFESADLELMKSVWANDAHVECIHPMSERLNDAGTIEDSWRSMFQQPLGLAIQIHSTCSTISDTLAVHVVDEHLTLVEGDKMQHSIIHATNVYQLNDAGWKMIVHHASPSAKPQQKHRISSEAVH